MCLVTAVIQLQQMYMFLLSIHVLWDVLYSTKGRLGPNLPLIALTITITTVVPYQILLVHAGAQAPRQQITPDWFA